MIVLDFGAKVPLYIQLYQHFRQEIGNSSLAEGERLPSIRRLAQSLGISKITVEKAYQQLACEGYVSPGTRSCYSVNRLEVLEITMPTALENVMEERSSRPMPEPVAYDFASGEMDLAGFDFALWKRYINKVFADRERLMGYGHVKGEEELRKQIAKYAKKSRGVPARPDQIVIGAGVQSLLGILCRILKRSHHNIAFEDPGFKNGRRIFADHDFDIIPVPMAGEGVRVQELTDSGTRLVYLTPSHQFPTGRIMPVGQRNRLLRWAQGNDGLIIEDDYDSELRYFGRPIPALTGMDSCGRVIYLGSFSKVIPPSIRISYLVLPDSLLEVYQENDSMYSQTAATLEQLALAAFMADGHFERQIRRLRKHYYEKNRFFTDMLRDVLGDRVELRTTESGLHITVGIKSPLGAKELQARALAQGCRVALLRDYYWEPLEESIPQVILYFSRIPAERIPAAVQALRRAWFPEQ
ncbi:MAG TPA: PLP-dependent aminotransferase family protein [Patescibacteria group bacterium]|nr:PLP-dependent aminotransferase family protein [Patescibacteria group bacterium]